MNNLKKNVTNIWGKKGDTWLKHLPDIVDKLTNNWQLTNIKPVSGMTYNYVAKAISYIYGPVVIKVSCDETLINDEVKALKNFSLYTGNNKTKSKTHTPTAKLLEYNRQYHALLLHQAVPGISLRSIYLDNVEQAIYNYANVVKEITLLPQKNHSNFNHIKDWLKSIDNVNKINVSKELIEYALDLKQELITSSGKEFLLHGDLHHDNLLLDGDKWMFIDPKGVIGEIEFEVAKFDFIHQSEFDNRDIPILFEKRSKLLASTLNINHLRLKKWAFIRSILAACWMVEDGGDPNIFLEQARNFFIT